MAVKQMVTSASLAIGLAGSTALADPGDSQDRSDLEAVTIGAEPVNERSSFLIGAGYGSDDGLVLRSAVASRDLFGWGQTLALSAELSRRRKLFLIHFEEPELTDDLGLSIDLQRREESWPGFDRIGAGGALTLSRRLGRNTRAFLAYRIEDVSVERDAPETGSIAREVAPGVGERASPGLVSALRLGVEHSTVDTQLFPRRGTSAGAWIEVAERRLGSDTDLVRGRAWLGHHRPFGPLTLHLVGSAEAVTSRDPLGVPLSERLQLDGSSELRGYAPGALGPVDALGTSLGGNVKLTGRVELEFPIAPRFGLSGAVFADAGALLDVEGRHGAAGSSVGFGLLWRSPIAPIRLDLAFPLDGDGLHPGLLFGLGVAF
jgi:outer membrane protein insertion porin family